MGLLKRKSTRFATRHHVTHLQGTAELRSSRARSGRTRHAASGESRTAAVSRKAPSDQR